MSTRSAIRATSVVAMLLLAASCEGACDGWNAALQRMVRQPRVGPWDPDPARLERETRATPEGTLPVDEPETEAPRPANLEGFRILALRGRERFDIACAPCHGTLGDAETPIADRMTLRRPPSLHEPRIARMSGRALYDVVTRGYGLMPSYARLLTPADRWAVVAWVRTLQHTHAPLSTLPPALQAEARQALHAH